MEHVSKIISALEPLETTTPADTLLKKAIADFQKFSGEYDEYFETLIRDNAFDPAKTTSDRLRYQCTQTLQTYWLSLEQVFLQRQVGYYQDKLKVAHQQAERYLEALGVNLPGVLIYFNKVSNIRYLPFTKIPILGIPHPFSGPEKWSAIPHELGHYIFWNLGNTHRETRQLQKQLRLDASEFLTANGVSQKHQDFILPWLEEIFSDVVGTRIDPLGFISSSEEFVNTQAGNEQELTLNDGHHPPLVFRPFVWAQALKSLAKSVDLSKLSSFFDRATLANFSSLKIEASVPASVIIEEAKHVVGTIPNQGDYETQSVEELLPATGKFVDYLSGRMDDILAYIQPATRKSSAFQELKEFLREEGGSKELANQTMYELLLKPRILEGGYSHTHGIQTLHGWHESTTHSH